MIFCHKFIIKFKEKNQIHVYIRLCFFFFFQLVFVCFWFFFFLVYIFLQLYIDEYFTNADRILPIKTIGFILS